MRPFLFVTLLATFLCTCDSAQSTSDNMPVLGTAASPAVYTDFDEVAGLFNRDSDTTYLINFWATWCAPCREELPLLQRLDERGSARPLKIVLVSLDEEEDLGKIPTVLNELAPGLASVALTDEDDATWGKTVDRVWTGSLPTTVIYRGNLRYVYRRGFNTYADLERAVEPLMK